MPSHPDRIRHTESNTETPTEILKKYLDGLHYRLSLLAKSYHTDFDTSHIHLNTNSYSNMGLNPGLLCISRTAEQIRFIPWGARGRYLYLLHAYDPDVIGLYTLCETGIAREEFSPIKHARLLREFSSKLNQTEANPLYIAEPPATEQADLNLLSTSFKNFPNNIRSFFAPLVRRRYSIEISIKGRNIWGKPLGKGPLL